MKIRDPRFVEAVPFDTAATARSEIEGDRIARHRIRVHPAPLDALGAFRATSPFAGAVMKRPRTLFFPSLPPLEEPIRAEIFGIERLEQHAESLAAAQRVTDGDEPRLALLPRVESNGKALREANRIIADAVRQERWITPAAEWCYRPGYQVHPWFAQVGPPRFGQAGPPRFGQVGPGQFGQAGPPWFGQASPP